MAFLGVSALLITSLLFLYGDCEEVVLDNNEFLIYNKAFHKARITQWGTGHLSFGTREHQIEDNQLWFLEPHPYQDGCYYIKNEEYSKNRLAAHRTNGLISWDGPHHLDNLWKFEPTGDGFYSINNCYHKDSRIAKTGAGDRDIRVEHALEGALDARLLWKLVPRFAAEIYTDDVFHFDNRQGSTPITRTISYTTGLKRTSSQTVRSKVTMKASMTASVGMNKVTSEITAELENTLTSSSESTWSKTETMTFTIPAHKNVKVMQHKVNFNGVIPSDTCTLMTEVKLFESDSATFSDPDEFIINS